MNCDDDKQRREQPDLGDGGGLWTPELEESILVTDPSDTQVSTLRGEYAVHTAVVRGLAAYVSGLQHAIAGRDVSLTRVTVDWADFSDGAAPSPSAAVYSTEEAAYEADTGMAPADPTLVDADGGRVNVLLNPAQYKLNALMIDVRCSDRVQRSGVLHMLERGCNPVHWMSGFRLVLPRYHNAIAEYLLIGAQQPDSPDTAAAGVWPLSLKLTVRCPMYTVESLPLARTTATGDIVRGKSRI